MGSAAFFVGFSALQWFNTVTRVWSTLSVPLPRSQVTLASVKDLLLIAGGLHNGSVSAHVDILNTTSLTWTTGSLSQARRTISAATVGTLVVFAGGSLDGVIVSSVVDVYNASSNAWQSSLTPNNSLGIQHLAGARTNIGATSNGRAIFGGGSQGFFTVNNTQIADIYALTCTGDADCYYGVYCNGQETCMRGVCVNGWEPCLAWQSCNNTCSEPQRCLDPLLLASLSASPPLFFRTCWTPAGSPCDGGKFCSQQDTCDGIGTCIHVPQCQANPCRALCDEISQCTPSPEGTPCGTVMRCDGMAG